VVAPYALAVDKVMCSEVCPCDPGESGENKEKWQSIDVQTLKKYSRVIDDASLSATEAADYKKQGFNAPIVPFVWKSSGGFTKYQDCYEKELKPNQSKYPSLSSFLTDSKNYDFLVGLETTIPNCSGVCDLPLFYVTKSISEGPPTAECIAGTISFFSNGLTTDSNLFITAGLVALGAFMQIFGLCTKRAKDADDEDQKIN